MSLTTDAWSDPDLVSFLGTTAHFIVRNMSDGQLLLRSGLLAFRHIQGSHTGQNLASVLYKIIKEASIEQRVRISVLTTMVPSDRTIILH